MIYLYTYDDHPNHYQYCQYRAHIICYCSRDFGLAQVKAAARSRHDQLTLEVLRQFQTKEFVELLHYINSKALPGTLAEMIKLPAAEQVIRIQFGQQMESLGMMVAEGLINMELVDKTLGSFLTTAWEKSKPMFVDIRENQPDPFLGEYYQWLAEGIAERMEENPRQPFHMMKKRK